MIERRRLRLEHYNCDSLFAQAKKNFTETGTNKANANPMNLLSDREGRVAFKILVSPRDTVGL
jgi:hypothetical protein